jgi:hypothetical protein
VDTQKESMNVKITKEPHAYSDAVIDKCVYKLTVMKLEHEAAAIIKMAFSRPRLLAKVMTTRKKTAQACRTVWTRLACRNRMRLLRTERQAGVRPQAKAKAAARLLGPLLDVQALALPPAPVLLAWENAVEDVE